MKKYFFAILLFPLILLTDVTHAGTSQIYYECGEKTFALISDSGELIGSVRLLNSNKKIFFTYSLTGNNQSIISYSAEISPFTSEEEKRSFEQKIREDVYAHKSIGELQNDSKPSNHVTLSFEEYDLTPGDPYLAHSEIILENNNGEQFKAVMSEPTDGINPTGSVVVNCLSESSINVLNARRISRP